jgi:hypothetical protein
MSRERKHGETLEELKATGARRLPAPKRLTLPHLCEEFLSLVMSVPAEDFATMAPDKQARIDGERLGFAKAQEKLREFIALAGVAEISDLADIRDDRQLRPTLAGTMRLWMAEGGLEIPPGAGGQG